MIDSLLFWICIAIISATVIVAAVLFFRFSNAVNALKKTITVAEEEKQILAKNLEIQQSLLSSGTTDKSKIAEEKMKSDEKNRKIWQMSETVYKEKKKVDEENEKLSIEKDVLLKEKEKLEGDKKKFQDKNKKLWDQSIAIHKEKERIEILRKEIEEKHHDVTQSIMYAERIQHAILPSNEYMKKLLPESFILYRPKDIVSGDFYWATTAFIINETTGAEEEITYFSVVDCTGHGVPGAFMSMFGYSLLSQAVDELNITDTGKILDFLSLGVIRKLQNHNEELAIKDGMDISLCAWNKTKSTIYFSGVNNPLFIVRNSELLQFKPDKFSIGEEFNADFTGYSCIEIPVIAGDIIYIFSDGFVDQFGGPDKKKYLIKRFRETLLSIKNLSMDEQQHELDQIFKQWRGDIMQYDDVSVMGVRI